MELLTPEQRALFDGGGCLADYDVLKPIGKGKFSVVYRAARRRDGVAVALKKIGIFDLMDLRAREKTLKEVRLVQRVHHAHLIQYMDAFLDGKELYIAFEWAEAGDLKRQLRKANERHVRFDERTIWRYFTQLAAAVLHLHRSRIMHRDLKPANIFLTLQGIVKVGDLGLGRHLSEDTLEAHSKVGTPLYMSPEVLRGEGYDWKSDVWSLGCILYELAMLRSPFKAEGLNLVGLFHKINQGDYAPLPEIYSDHLRGLVQRMISLDPARRPAMDEVWAACEAWTARCSVPTTTTPTAAPTPAAATTTNRRSTKVRATTTIASKTVPVATRAAEDDDARAPREINQPEEPRPPSSSVSSSSSSASSAARPSSRPPSTVTPELSVDERHQRETEARMETLTDRLLILRYPTQISRGHFLPESRALPARPQCFRDFTRLAKWLLRRLSRADGELPADLETRPPVVATQVLLLAAERLGVGGVAHLSAAALTSGRGHEACTFLDAVSTHALREETARWSPPVHPTEPLEELDEQSSVEAGDDGEQAGDGESTASVSGSEDREDDDDCMAQWLVVGESGNDADDEDRRILHGRADPVAWYKELERIRVCLGAQWAATQEAVVPTLAAPWSTRLETWRRHAMALERHQCPSIEALRAIRERIRLDQERITSGHGHLQRTGGPGDTATEVHRSLGTRLTAAHEHALRREATVRELAEALSTVEATRRGLRAELEARNAQLADDSELRHLRASLQRLSGECRRLLLEAAVLRRDIHRRER